MEITPYLAMSTLFAYFLPLSLFPRSVPLVILALAFFGMLMYTSGFRIRRSVATIFLLAISISLIIRDWIPVATMLFIAAYLLTARRVRQRPLSQNLLRYSIYATSASLTAQLAYFSGTMADADGRSGLGTDPNFSGFMIFTFFVAASRVSLPAAALPLVLGIIYTQSRLLVLSVAVYYIVLIASRNPGIYRVSSLVLRYPLIAIFGSTALVLLAAFYAAANVTFVPGATGNIVNRLAVFNDGSTQGRFAAYVFWANESLRGTYLIDGLKLDSLSVSDRKFDILPHNSFIYALVSDSAVYLMFVVLCLKLVAREVSSLSGLALFVAYVFYSQFLHGLFSPIFVFYFVFALFMTEGMSRYQMAPNVQGRL